MTSVGKHRQIFKTPQLVKDHKLNRQNAIKVLNILLSPNFDPMAATDQLANISMLGPPLKIANNNYWAKKIKRFYEGTSSQHQKNYQSFANMEYKEALRQAAKDLKSKNSKMAFRDLKRMTKYQNNSRILNPKAGPLKGKFAKDLKD